MLYYSTQAADSSPSLLERFLDDTFTVSYRTPSIQLTNFYENDTGYLLQFMAPGVEDKDIAVTLESNILSVAVRREAADNLNRDVEHKEIRRERDNLDYTRTYRLSGNADPAKVTAKLANGMLLVIIGKKEEVEPQKIAVTIH